MYKGKVIGVIIAAAGSGSRMKSGGNTPKQFMKVDGVPMVRKTTMVFQNNPYVDHICIVTAGQYKSMCSEMLKDLEKVKHIAIGGRERQDSVGTGLRELSQISDFDYVIIHDGARPYVTDRIIEDSLEMALKTGACTAAVPVKDTVRQGDITLERDELFLIQTPQTFKREIIVKAYEKACSDGYMGTDDGSIAERMGITVAMVQGDYGNIKITTKEDLPMELRVGCGYDVHRLEEGRPLILGGKELLYEKGLQGHSDADVLAHAVMDALLGAAALGDIGKHFPDSEPIYKGISSMKLMELVGEMIVEEGYIIGNVDATVIAQNPRLAPYIEEMRENIAKALGLPKERVSVKATTTEKLGFSGRGEGIAAEAVAVIKSR